MKRSISIDSAQNEYIHARRAKTSSTELRRREKWGAMRCDENTHGQVGRTCVRSIDSVRSDLLRRRGAKRIVVLWIYHSWESPNRVIIIAPRGRGTLSLSLSLSLCLFEVGLSGIGQCSEVILVSLAIAHFQSLTCKKKLGRHSKSHPFPSPKHTHTHRHTHRRAARTTARDTPPTEVVEWPQRSW